jgi:dihydrofolate reductase
VGRILVHEFVSLDGVFEDPRWTFDFEFDPRMGEAIAGVMGSCEAILLGRRTYEMFAPAWSARSAADDPGAPFMNDSPKYVVSGTLAESRWTHTNLLGPYAAESIRSLKETVTGGIYVSGSGTLVSALLADGLVDELHLFTFPVVLGAGRRLLPEGLPKTRFELERAEAYSSGVVHLAYRAPG